MALIFISGLDKATLRCTNYALIKRKSSNKQRFKKAWHGNFSITYTQFIYRALEGNFIQKSYQQRSLYTKEK